MSFEFDNNGEFTVDYSKVLNQESYLPVTRLLAADLIKTQYMSIGDFLQSLRNNSLEELNEIAADERSDHFEEIILITEMLSAAEGTASGPISEVHERVNMFITYLIFESLKRKGFINIFYENISFGEDMRDKIIVQKIND